MMLIPFGIFVDPLPFFMGLLLFMFPPLEKLVSNEVFLVASYLILGGVQWYVLGWLLSEMLRKSSWRNASN